MVVNSIAPMLMDIGFSEYEARAYLALLGKNPSSAYEVARGSGIPTSKIYEVAARLLEKGIISEMGGEGTKKYFPMKPDELIESLRNRNETALTGLQRELGKVATGASEVSYIWNVTEYEYLMDKALRMTRDAGSTLLVSIWKEEMQSLRPALEEAAGRGVRVSAVHFGMKGPYGGGVIFQHPIHDTIYAEKGGRGLVIVSDSAEALMGTISAEGSVEGALSSSKGFVTLAEDYIKHDIYVMKMVKRFDRQLRERFGEGYEFMRDVFSDGERQ